MPSAPGVAAMASPGARGARREMAACCVAPPRRRRLRLRPFGAALFGALCCLGLLLHAQPAQTAASPKRWVVRHGFGTNDVTYSRIAPILRFPTSHPKVADGVCGGIGGVDAPDRLIRPTEGWSTYGRVHAGDSSCADVSGAEAFFAYNYPVAAGSNTGFQADDTELLMLLQDTAGAGYLLLNHDKPDNPDGGRTIVVLDSPSLAVRLSSPPPPRRRPAAQLPALSPAQSSNFLRGYFGTVRKELLLNGMLGGGRGRGRPCLCRTTRPRPRAGRTPRGAACCAGSGASAAPTAWSSARCRRTPSA